MNIPNQSAGTNRRYAPGRAANTKGSGVTASGIGAGSSFGVPCGSCPSCFGGCVFGFCVGACMG